MDFLRNTLSTHLFGNLVEMNEMIVRESSFHSIPSWAFFPTQFFNEMNMIYIYIYICVCVSLNINNLFHIYSKWNLTSEKSHKMIYACVQVFFLIDTNTIDFQLIKSVL